MTQIAHIGGIRNLPFIVRHLTTVGIAILDRDGNVIDSSAGFALLLGLPQHPDNRLPNVSEYFINPGFRQLLDSPADPVSHVVYRGLLNLGKRHSVCRTLHGVVYGMDGLIYVVAEYDIREVEKLAGTILELNEELAEKQRAALRANRRLAKLEADAQQQSRTDALTQLANRRRFDEQAEREVRHSRQSGMPLALLIIDIDHFKQINDRFGHPAGDSVLQAVAQTLHEAVLGADLLARIGGEEFAILLTDTGLENARRVAARIHDRLAQADMAAIGQRVTVSIGIAALGAGQSLGDLLRQADEALYTSKQLGRNRTTVAGQSGNTPVER